MPPPSDRGPLLPVDALIDFLNNVVWFFKSLVVGIYNAICDTAIWSTDLIVDIVYAIPPIIRWFVFFWLCYVVLSSLVGYVRRGQRVVRGSGSPPRYGSF
ncbi:hypothetical protein BJ508DRAFT_415611 [Ascobolus immersus RN42]|uniref:Uncharacterized protein n=1 Tax=Ascobolus immersus RN42 TaxID=1160509 RepID=A0A3N4I777_ASCIM|nr:hypothetical protein BJ508DRAFT_415611 [Ascobolus immersus RN42]